MFPTALFATSPGRPRTASSGGHPTPQIFQILRNLKSFVPEFDRSYAKRALTPAAGGRSPENGCSGCNRSWKMGTLMPFAASAAALSAPVSSPARLLAAHQFYAPPRRKSFRAQKQSARIIRYHSTLQNFIVRHIDSIAQIEACFLSAVTRPTRGTSHQQPRRLYVSSKESVRDPRELSASGLLRCEAGVYRLCLP